MKYIKKSMALIVLTSALSTSALASGLTGVTIAPPKATKQLIVLIHGFTNNGAWWKPYAPAIHSHFPNAVIVAPNAPEMVPKMGKDNLRWGAVLDSNNKIKPADRPDPDRFLNFPTVKYNVQLGGIKKNGKILNDYIMQQMQKHGVGASSTAIIGFSQGGVMAFNSGFTLTKPVAGVVSFGGILMNSPSGLASEIKSRPDILIVQGAKDEIVLKGAADDAEKRLKAQNFNVQKVILPTVGHAVEIFGFHKAMEFLDKRLK